MPGEVIDLMRPGLEAAPHPIAVDATLGMGGHAERVLSEFPEARLIGLDRDTQALELAAERLAPFGSRFTGVHTAYDGIGRALTDLGLADYHAGLFDLGVSSLQLDREERGFAYRVDAPLDMRMDATTGQTAADILNTYPAPELVRILRDFGEERFASRIVGNIVKARAEEPFTTSGRLVELLYASIPAATRRSGGHPAKRTFQALRIEVNGELDNLAAALPVALDRLAVGGHLVVMSYQSLEDRLVKKEFAARVATLNPPGLPVDLPGTEPEFALTTRGARTASAAEIDDNPRAAPARVRAITRLRPAAPSARPTRKVFS